MGPSDGLDCNRPRFYGHAQRLTCIHGRISLADRQLDSVEREKSVTQSVAPLVQRVRHKGSQAFGCVARDQHLPTDGVRDAKTVPGYALDWGVWVP